MPQHKQIKTPLQMRVVVWITLSLCLVVAPHIGRLPLWLNAFIAVAVLLKLTYRKHARLFSHKGFTLLLSSIALMGVALQYARIFGRDAGVALLIIMLFLKLLESKTYRDGMVIIGMTYFLVITNFLYTQSIPTALYMLFTLLVTTTALIILNTYQQQPLFRDTVKTAGIIIIQTLPLMLILFLLFPRLPGPLWGLPADAHSGKSGLSESMTPGHISELALSDEVAFRAKFTGDIPSANALYWRAIVLWDFDGRSWTRGQHPREKAAPYATMPRHAVNYEITLEAHNRHWLFVLDMPGPQLQVEQAWALNSDYLLISKQPVDQLQQYRANSYIQYHINTDLSATRRTAGLALPADFNPQARALAQHWRDTNEHDSGIVLAALHMFNRETFIYTLLPPPLGRHSVDEFLFNSKRGFCEHYASSFAFLMRAAGIPARIVAGYQGGEHNPIDNYLIIRQADAHAWVEVWLDTRGWVRIDPTAVVAPQRIQNNLDLALSPQENPRFIFKRNNAFIAKMVLTWDAINNRWNQWVLNYDAEAQKNLLARVGIDVEQLYQHVVALTLLLASAALLLAITILYKRNKNDPVLVCYEKFCSKLAKAGAPRKPYEGPMAYSQRLLGLLPQQQSQITRIVQYYIGLRYSNRSFNPQLLRSFKQQVHKFRPARH